MHFNFKLPPPLRDPRRNNLPGLCWAIAFACLALMTLVAAPAIAFPDPLYKQFATITVTGPSPGAPIPEVDAGSQFNLTRPL